MDTLLKVLAQTAPTALLLRSLFEHAFSEARLKAWFEQTATRQYTRQLAFASVVEAMLAVVTRQARFPRQAYLQHLDQANVPLTAFYNQLNAMELSISAGLVALSAQQRQGLIAAYPIPHHKAWALSRTDSLDGNTLGKRHHRLAENWTTTAALLPGQALIVDEPKAGLITHLVPCADAYTQERVLLEYLEPLIDANDLWLADRHFCTRALSPPYTPKAPPFLLLTTINNGPSPSFAP